MKNGSLTVPVKRIDGHVDASPDGGLPADRGGADRYAPMRLVKDGDLILHSVAGDLVGFSRAAGTVAEVTEEPPDAGNWAEMSPYYRIDLRNYQRLARPISLRELAGQPFEAHEWARLRGA